MNWTAIDWDGTNLWAIDFLDGVWVKGQDGIGAVFVPGYYVQEQHGDMDGPALRERPKQPLRLGVELVQTDG